MLQSFRDYLNWAELKQSWFVSGAAGLFFSAVVALLNYWQGALANDPNPVISGLVATLLALAVTQLRKMQEGLPPPRKQPAQPLD